MGSKLGKIQAALKDGCFVYAFMAVNGSVSVSIMKGGHLLGFGESTGVLSALRKVDEGLSISGVLVEKALAVEVTTYEEIIDIVAVLDEQMRSEKMSTFIASWDSEKGFSFRLNGTREVSAPGDMIELVVSTGREVVWSSERGYSYVIAPDSKGHVVGPISTVLLFAPDGKGDDGFGLSYPISKIGFGQSFWEAVYASVYAQEFETSVARK